MKKRGLIFDMDGVILDSEIRYFEVHQQMFKTLSIPLDPVQYATFMGKTGDEMWEELVAQHQLKETASALLEEEHRLFQIHAKPEECGLKEGVKQVIEQAASLGYDIGIASSSSLQKIERVIRHYKLPITHYVSGEEVVRSKPDPAIFHLAASRIGHAPEDCLVIEDAANGMIGAKAAGMEVIALLDDRMPMQRLEQADHVARSHAEIEEILRKR
ncbi:HAD family hydrolase [Exiguobacterium acetylicum]|uniref:HAD family hydrolase n=1 Tax=Exiguobacterium acetylicum TaxID=41170 RepID=UPI0038775692